MKYLFLLSLMACGSYTDPKADRVTEYKCQNDRTLFTRFSEDYDNITIQYTNPPRVLHRYVTETEDGYRSDDFIWRVNEDKGGEFIQIMDDGSNRMLVSGCQEVESIY